MFDRFVLTEGDLPIIGTIYFFWVKLYWDMTRIILFSGAWLGLGIDTDWDFCIV